MHQVHDRRLFGFAPGVCMGCGKRSTNLLTCGMCKTFRYCSKKCQSWAWKGTTTCPSHKHVCRIFVAANAAVGDGALTSQHEHISINFNDYAGARVGLHGHIAIRLAARFLEERLKATGRSSSNIVHIPIERATLTLGEVRAWFNGHEELLKSEAGAAYLHYVKDRVRFAIGHLLMVTEPSLGVALPGVMAALVMGHKECAVCCSRGADVACCPSCFSMYLCPQHASDPLHTRICARLASVSKHVEDSLREVGTKPSLPRHQHHATFVVPNLPLDCPKQPAPDNWDTYFDLLGLTEEQQVQRLAATTYACRPMTLMWGIKQAGLVNKKQLTVYMIGATEDAELETGCIVEYMHGCAAFLHGTHVDMVAVGPGMKGLPAVKINQPHLQMRTLGKMYENSGLPPPDVAFIFDGGLGFESFHSTGDQSWDAGIRRLARQKVPVFITAFGDLEAAKDLNKLRELRCNITLQPMENPFRSLMQTICLPLASKYAEEPTGSVAPNVEPYLRAKWEVEGRCSTVYAFQGFEEGYEEADGEEEKAEGEGSDSGDEEDASLDLVKVMRMAMRMMGEMG